MATIYKKDNQWRAQVRRKGIVKSKQGFKTKREAQEWAFKIEQDIDDYHGDVIPDRPFLDALERYGDTVSLKKKGMVFEIRRINRWIGKSNDAADPICFIPLRNLKPKHFADWRDRRLKQVTPGTVLREWSILSAVCTQCVNEWGWLRENPMKKIERPAEPAPRTRRISEDEIDRIVFVSGYEFGTFPQTKSEFVGAAFLFAIETAMRAGEILNLTWDDISFESRTAFIAHSKNGSSRTVPLSKKAIEILSGIKSLTSKGDKIFDVTKESRDAIFRKIRNK